MAVSQVDIGSSSFGKRLGDLNREWATRQPDERYLTIQALHAAARAHADRARTIEVDMKHLEFFADSGKIAYSTDGINKLQFTPWSFGQMCSRMSGTLDDDVLEPGVGIPSRFISHLNPEIGASVLNDVNLRRRETADAKSAIYYDGQSMATHAVTSSRFSRIHDVEVAKVAMDVMDRFHWSVPGVLNWRTGGYRTDTPVTPKTTTLFRSDRDIFLCIVDHEHPIEVGKLRNGDAEVVYRGAILRNSEVGAAKFSMKTFLFAAVCANRNIWGVRDLQQTSIRHVGRATQRFYDEAMPGFVAFVKGDASGIVDGVKKAKERILLDRSQFENQKEIAIASLRILTNMRIPEKLANDMLREGALQLGYLPASAWDFAQVITAGAQLAKFQDERFEMELKAETILTGAMS
jgi:hypothetical protein